MWLRMSAFDSNFYVSREADAGANCQFCVLQRFLTDYWYCMWCDWVVLFGYIINPALDYSLFLTYFIS